MRLKKQDFHKIVDRIEFRLIDPDESAPKGAANSELKIFGKSFVGSHLNTHFGSHDGAVREWFGHMSGVVGMSTIANAYLIHEVTKYLDENEMYLNVGVWRGFSFFAGVLNRLARSVGVDNFSEFNGPREEFMSDFHRLRHEKASFFDMDFRDYFASHHVGQIGLYFYDGAHDYQSQYDALQISEPHLSKNAIIFVDDTNHRPARDATLDFTKAKHGKYEILFDQFTCTPSHPTYHNGMLVLRKVE